MSELPVMSAVRSGVGGQLREARRRARLSIAEVAERSGLTKGFLSKVERDLATPSVASLIRLCATLGVSVGSLFEVDSGEVVRKSDYPPINFGGVGIEEFLLTPPAERRIQAIMSVIEPGGGSGDEPYGLPGEAEFAYVVSGTLLIGVGTEQIILHAGDAYTFPPGREHTFRAVETRWATEVLWVISPALPGTEPNGAGPQQYHQPRTARRRRKSET